MIINHQRNRFKNWTSKQKCIKLIAEEKNIFNTNNYELDHIIPYCISTDNNMSNLQLIKKSEHKIKTRIDFIILKQLRKEGYTSKVTNYSIELLKPQKEVILRYKELLEQVEQVEQVR